MEESSSNRHNGETEFHKSQQWHVPWLMQLLNFTKTYFGFNQHAPRHGMFINALATYKLSSQIGWKQNSLLIDIST